MRFNTELKIHLGQMANNFELLKKAAPTNEIIFMVKANAYGHGLFEIVHFAFHELGIKRFGCASLGEAIALRHKFPEMPSELWVFSDLSLMHPKAKEAYLDQNIIPVISHLNDLSLILEDKDFAFLPLVLKFDTGMNRLGFNLPELKQVIAVIKSSGRKQIKHLMTHFANSYLTLKEKDKTHRQYNEFLLIKKERAANGIQIHETSCANSGAIEQGFSLEESHIRPGLMMYGASSSKHWKGELVSEFRTQILKIIPIKKGVPIGYGSHVCGHNGHIVYITAGYGDGLLTYYSGQEFFYHGKIAKILGRVNMDLTAVFFKELPDQIENQNEFYLWDIKNTQIEELASRFKTTPYQLFTAISSRVPRRYLY